MGLRPQGSRVLPLNYSIAGSRVLSAAGTVIQHLSEQVILCGSSAILYTPLSLPSGSLWSPGFGKKSKPGDNRVATRAPGAKA